MKISIGISNVHAHLTQEQIDTLFGQGYKLTFLKGTSQLDEYVTNETIDVVGPKGTLKGVRIVGPARGRAQVEITLTKAREIGVEAQIRFSTDTDGTSGIKLVGPVGEMNLDEGVIAAARHIHIPPNAADQLGLKAGQKVSVETTGDRAVIFKNVTIRIDELFTLEMHLDTDEANAAGLKKGDSAELIL